MAKKNAILLFLLPALGCGKGVSSSGNFPKFDEIAKEVAPLLSGSAKISLDYDFAAAQDSTSTLIDSNRVSYLSLSPVSEWETYNSYGALKDVLGDPNEDPKVVTKMYILLADMQKTIDTVNQNYTDAEGNPAQCKEDTAGKSIKTPWFTVNGQTPFFDLDDSKVYSCRIEPKGDTGAVVYAGRSKIAGAASDCTDPNIYYAMKSFTSSGANSEQVSERGNTVKINSIIKAYYEGCSKNFKLAYAHTTQYGSGVAFTSRTEIDGNRGTHLFRIRGAKLDVTKNPDGLLTTSWFTTTGHGKSQAISGAENFLISYRSYDGKTNTTKKDKTFCISVGSTAFQYTAVSTGCDNYVNAFNAIDHLKYAQIPQGDIAMEF